MSLSLSLPPLSPPLLSISGVFSTRATCAQSVDLEPIRNALAVLAAVVKQVTDAQTHTLACRAKHMHTHTHTQTHFYTRQFRGLCLQDQPVHCTGCDELHWGFTGAKCTAQGFCMCCHHITQPPHWPYRNRFPYQSSSVRSTAPGAHRAHQGRSLGGSALTENTTFPYCYKIHVVYILFY